VQSFAAKSGIVATVTGTGTVVPTIGNQSWFEYGGRLGFRITQGWVADLFLNGTAGPQPVRQHHPRRPRTADQLLTSRVRHEFLPRFSLARHCGPNAGVRVRSAGLMPVSGHAAYFPS
jgi:hypothetical protein